MEKDIEARPCSPNFDTAHGKVEFPVAPTALGRFVDSFKRNPNARVTAQAVDANGKPLPDQPPAEPALAMKLKERHLQMIAIGGSIGRFWSAASTPGPQR
jgi:amino acid transporter